MEGSLKAIAENREQRKWIRKGNAGQSGKRKQLGAIDFWDKVLKI